ncbi:MAG: (2,3-dihydroxybenzoyl)adenylate synthase [Candidatus Nephthysia bennettiae]|uniref:AMP-binding protein n=1 Tax=Candidatus Nephthysia bennettiae TaxID=3127016 RepID=A0A934K2N9_9BACT|nr:AMP-binding protein [Candidatus Dormibacteraeota bacterium]MBJ7611859.1 AMP-binding protein [Candidatus Dormibacteraeota bacterium]PZR89007.1 MAG: (2,3-dihydroxybenzoyl)adenylate synthase [Candidatus Dormibacteraeota bacterium]
MSKLPGVTPFPAGFAARCRAAGYWEDRPLGAFYDEVFASHGARTALVHGDETVSYAQLKVRVDRLARHLLRMGVRPLDRFVMQLPNVPEFVYLYFALERLGAIPIMALASHRWTEVSAFIELAGARGYILPARLGDFDFAELAGRLTDRYPGLDLLLTVGGVFPGAVSVTDLLTHEASVPASALDEVAVDPDEPCVFQLSGGTTGVPKLIPRTHNDYVYNTKAAVAVNDVRADDCLLVTLPIAHNFPLACPGVSGFFMRGARVVLSNSTRPDDILALVEREGVTHLELVPALLIRCNNSSSVSTRDLSSLRVINTGGQKLQPEVKRRAEELIPTCRVQEVFGMAEGLLCFVRLDDPADVRYETVGRPVSPDDELLLVGEDGHPVPDGEVGELLVRGPYTLRGYYGVPEYNARTFTADGFYRSGDLMRRHPSGNYVVEGRKKDLINRGGEKISAEEVENLILSHPAVLNVACVPMPDPVLGERMCAFAVLREGKTLSQDELAAFLADRGLARFKLPERLELVDDLPLSKFGKVAKNVLSQLAAARVAGVHA